MGGRQAVALELTTTRATVVPALPLGGVLLLGIWCVLAVVAFCGVPRRRCDDTCSTDHALIMTDNGNYRKCFYGAASAASARKRIAAAVKWSV